jgi:hypothetical protein
VYIPMELTESIYSTYPSLAQATSCYGSKLELRCPGGQFIHVYAAYYGNQPSTTPNYCNPAIDVVCYRAMSCDYVIESCENRSACELVVNERVLGNPCPDIGSNQFVVQYECLEREVIGGIVETCDTLSKAQLEPNCPIISNSSLSFQQV